MKGFHLRSMRDRLVKAPSGGLISHEEKALYLKLSKTPKQRCDKILSEVPFNRLCRMYCESDTSIHDCNAVDALFKKKFRYEIIRKIMSSAWRWGSEVIPWNEIVDAYRGIRGFTLGDSQGFEVRLDYSTYHNERGYSKCARVFLDGVFGFLIYHRGIHVLTIGFSILNGKRILIQQVQTARQKGCRALYKLPENRLEFVIERFRSCFPEYALYVADGGSLVDGIVRNYQNGLRRTEQSLEICLPGTAFRDEVLSEHEEWRQRIERLKRDRKRLARFYRNAGKFRLDRKDRYVRDQLVHFRVAP